jgi:hypothetical protein
MYDHRCMVLGYATGNQLSFCHSNGDFVALIAKQQATSAYSSGATCNIGQAEELRNEDRHNEAI